MVGELFFLEPASEAASGSAAQVSEPDAGWGVSGGPAEPAVRDAHLIVKSRFQGPGSLADPRMELSSKLKSMKVGRFRGKGQAV